MNKMQVKKMAYVPATLCLVCLLALGSCINHNITGDTYNAATAYSLQNISYGGDAQQKMDIYLPANRSADSTKVFVLVHGGGWTGGDKADYSSFLDGLKNLYPNYAVINLNYRLATAGSPGYPKQINDIQAALDEIQLPKYGVSKQYFFFGASAGGHLSLLYAYAFDGNHYVKAVCNTVGPTDFTDTAYTNNPVLAGVVAAFPGASYTQNPALFAEVSPAKRVTPSSPRTLSFYGSADPLIPSSQMGLLHDELTAKGVYNEATMYPGEGHGTWNATNTQDAINKMMSFISRFF
ncbi:MAG TPA: alpha/beta hydrolase [Chitinophagales bacterium]|nr:alpha/beta hydrolase [Chitinophagales bacterium]